MIKLIIAITAGLFLVMLLTDPRPEATPAPVLLSQSQRTQCRDLLALGEKNGIILGRPSPNRINVDDVAWQQLDAETKDRTLQAVSCDLWGTWLPADADHVVAYGNRSGKRIQMLTSVGMSRE